MNLKSINKYLGGNIMTYKEFIEHCQNNRIDPVGLDVWITDIRLSDGDKLIRNVRAERFNVIHAKDAKRTVYYADHALQHYGRIGKLLSKVSMFYDNTGNRSYEGVSVNVYFTKEEAEEKMKTQLEDIRNSYQIQIDYYNRMINKIDNEISEVHSKK